MEKPELPLVEDVDAPRELKEALRAARARGPSHADLTRLTASFGFELPSSLPPPLPAPAAPAAGAASAKLGLLAKGAAALGAASVATAVVLRITAPLSEAPPAPSVREVASAARLEPAPLATEPLVLPSSTPAPLAVPLVRAHREERSPRETAPSAPSAEPEAPPVAAASSQAARDVASRLREEALLVRRAQSLLSSDPAAALRLTAERRRQFPGGVLGQEASVVAIEALLRLGRRSEAEAQARAFEAAHPGSVHARRVRKLLEAE